MSAVLPAYNEAANIEACVVVAHALLSELVADFEIIVVDDGSQDRTADLVDALSSRYPKLRCLRHEVNLGYGTAIRNGFREARYELLFFTDADRQFDVSDLQDLLPLMDEHDIAVGYRVNRQDTLSRRILSWGYNVVARQLFGFSVRDVDCAFKVFRRAAVERIQLESERWFVNTEILAKATILRMKIAQRPITHLPRVADRSKVGFGDVPRTVRELRRIKRQLAAWKKKQQCTV